MNLIETSVKYDSLEEAEDALAGLRATPGFILGYVRLPAGASDEHVTIAVVDCAPGTEPLPDQRRVHIPANQVHIGSHSN
jgi:hypothetical protein